MSQMPESDIEILSPGKFKKRNKYSSLNSSSLSDTHERCTIIEEERSPMETMNRGAQICSPSSPDDGRAQNDPLELTGADLDIDYGRWKKRRCCHQFPQKNLEIHFWIFYEDNHSWTIQVVLTAVCVFTFGGMVGDYLEWNDNSICVYRNLLYLRLLMSGIILVFLTFFYVGVNQSATSNFSDSDNQLTFSNFFSTNSTKRSDYSLNESTSGQRSDLSWYLRLGAWIVRHSFWSVFTICICISVLMILISIVGEIPSHKPYIFWFFMIHIFCGLGSWASSLICWTIAVTFCIFNLFIGDEYPIRKSIYVVSASIAFSILGEFLEFSYRRLFFKRVSMEYEHFKNDLMLINVLPRRVAFQLKLGKREAVSYEWEEPNWGASVLFCQICDFEKLSNELPATGLVAYLNKVFTYIDLISTQNKVYKVETVKEVYMAACGLPRPKAGHVNQIAHFALDIMMILVHDILAIEGRPDIEPPSLKIGINCGTVIAGVIGKLCPRYRLFGDTVNVAARMETNSEKGKIQITEKFKNRIDDKVFRTKSRGKIRIKGKDLMSTHFLTGRRENGPADLSTICDDYHTIRSRRTTSPRDNYQRLSNILQHRPTIFDFCLQKDNFVGLSQSEPCSSLNVRSGVPRRITVS